MNDLYFGTEILTLDELKDEVAHPKHYTKNGIECLEAIESSMDDESFKGYLKGNIMKYLWRYTDKGGIQDLCKAYFYLNKLLDAEYKSYKELKVYQASKTAEEWHNYFMGNEPNEPSEETEE